MTAKKLSIIIPVYNERPWLQRLWNEIKRAPLSKCHGLQSLEIIFVDDGSNDGSSAILKGYAESQNEFEEIKDADVLLLTQRTRKGKGAAVRKGIDQSSGDAIVILDADLEYSVEDLPTMVNPILDESADVVLGSRFVGPRRRVLLFWHAVANRFLTLLCNLFNNINITDISSGYKAFSGDIARSLSLKSEGFGIEPELICKTAKARLRVYEVPVSYSGRAYYDGKKFTFADGWKMLFQTIKFGLFDTEPFKAGLWQTLTALDSVSDIIYAPLLKKAIAARSHFSELPKILEIGAGTGSLTKELVNFGSVVATDIATHFVDRLKHRFGARGDFEFFLWDASKPFLGSINKFDYIVCFNVLEHIEHDIDALVKWRGLLNPNGRLIILVPNVKWLFSAMDSAAGHFRRYNRKDLTGKLKQAGFECEDVFYGNALGMLGWLHAKLSKKETLPIKQLKLYAFVKRLVLPLEWFLERFTGLSIITVSRAAHPALVPKLSTHAMDEESRFMRSSLEST